MAALGVQPTSCGLRRGPDTIGGDHEKEVSGLKVALTETA